MSRTVKSKGKRRASAARADQLARIAKAIASATQKVSASPRDALARPAAVLCVIISLWYLHWRWTSTLNPDAMVFSLLLLAAEAIGFLELALFIFMTWDTRRKALFVPRRGLRVDVFVPTCDEDLGVLEATLTGCQAMTYPHKTYVLDDGKRPAVGALAQRLGCEYLTREDNAHAKAGNLNAALFRTSGEFIMVVDADTVPQPDLLDKTLGYFADERVALVQLPQEFYNVDSLQHSHSRPGALPWHEQALFYRVIQPGKNRWNAAFWCGSPSVVRRAALVDVGGVATGSITEDLHTSMRIHRRGWKTVYHNEALAFGIAPQTMMAFEVQRLRWAQGTMQLFRSRENPLIVPGLTLAQRLNYFASMFTYFVSFQKLVYLLSPAAILLTGALPLSVDAMTFLAYWSTYFVAGTLANTALGRGNYKHMQIEMYNALKMFSFIWAATELVWPRRLKFKVTPKGSRESRAMREWMPTDRLALVAALLLASMIVGVANLLWQVTATYAKLDILLITLCWTTFNLGLIAAAVGKVVRRLHRRRSYRFPVDCTVGVADGRGHYGIARVSDISRDGLSIVFDASAPDNTINFLPGERIVASLRYPEGWLDLNGEIASVVGLSGGRSRLGIHLLPMEDGLRETFFKFLFVTLPRAIASGEPSISAMSAPPAFSVAGHRSKAS